MVFHARLVRNGNARIETETYRDGHSPPTIRSITVPAVVVPVATTFQLPSGMITKELAERLDIPGVAAQQFLIDTTREPTEREIDRAQAEIERLGGQMYLHVERGYTGTVGLGLLALLAASAVVRFGASGIATGLGPCRVTTGHVDARRCRRRTARPARASRW